MKFNDVSFPHPVLGVSDDIKGEIGLSPEPDIVSGEDNYKITVSFHLDNDDLLSLLKAGKAEYFCEATCSNTLFRQIFKSGLNKIEFEIPKKQVKGRVEFTCILTAKTDLIGYKNKGSHVDYSEFSFDLDAGDILGYFGSFSFEADINYEKLKAVSSFMEVVENGDASVTFTNIDLNKNKIEIQLPVEDYKIFASSEVSQEEKFASVFHSSIVLNALLTALFNLENYEDTLWARVINYRLANEKQFEGISVKEKENIPEIAQRLLGNPFNRLISGLKTIKEFTNEEED